MWVGLIHQAPPSSASKGVSSTFEVVLFFSEVVLFFSKGVSPVMNHGTGRSKTAHFRSFRPATLSLARVHSRAYTIIALFLPSLPSPASYILAITAPFTPCFWYFSRICLHPQISVDERLAVQGEGVKAKNTDYCRAYARVRISGEPGVAVVKPADQGEARGLLF